MIKKIRIYPKKNEIAETIKKELETKLMENGFIITDNDYELAISIGGDGTFLKMIHANNFNTNILYIGINAGSLGFLSSVKKDDIDKFINCLKNENYYQEKLSVLKTIVTSNEESYDIFSINEITIRNNNFTTLKLEINVNDILLNNFVGDGISICTAIGSTGYNLSLNGPIIDNNLRVLTLNFIAPINNSIFNSITNSIVLNQDKELIVKPSNSNNICFVSDCIIKNIADVKVINIKISDIEIKKINLENQSPWNNLINKIIDKK